MTASIFFLNQCQPNPASFLFFQGVVLGVDLVDEENADKILGTEEAKGDKNKGSSKTGEEAKGEEAEELPAWQDKPAVPEFHFDSSSSSSGGGGGVGSRCEQNVSPSHHHTVDVVHRHVLTVGARYGKGAPLYS